MRGADANNKALIFTQYNDTIKYLGKKLEAAGFAFRTISGSMAMKQRSAAIEAFQRDPPTTVRAAAACSQTGLMRDARDPRCASQCCDCLSRC